MFDLEQAISRWREELLAAQVAYPVQLQELENHLREEIERQAKTGLNEQSAFDFAVQKIGNTRTLKLEFKKVAYPIESRIVRLAGISCGFIAVSFSLWILFNLLVIHKVNFAERIAGLVAFVLVILSWRYGGRFLPAIPHPQARTMAGFLSCLASAGGMMLFVKSLPYFLEVPAGAEFPVGRFLVVFIWMWTVAALLAAIAYRLEDAARKNDEQYV